MNRPEVLGLQNPAGARTGVEYYQHEVNAIKLAEMLKRWFCARGFVMAGKWKENTLEILKRHAGMTI